MSASRLKQSTKRHNANISMAYGCDKDPNTYCYRLTNGHKHLHRIILGRGWEHTPFDVTKLSCYEGKKGEESMAHRTGYHKQWLPWDELMPKVEKMLGEGKDVPYIAQALGIKKDTLWKRLYLNKKKAQTPPEPTGDQTKPAQSEASAPDIVPEKEITVKDVLLYEIEQQRKNYTISQYDADMTRAQTEANKKMSEIEPIKAIWKANPDIPNTMTEERQTALQIYLENQSCESLLKRWAGEVFEHSGLSIERKLELIGQLLEWRAGA